MKIETLAGAKTLTGVDISFGNHNLGICRIALDGQTYEFVETRFDEHRSQHYGPVEIKAAVENTFDPVPVVCQHVQKSVGECAGGEADILRVIKIDTGRVILDVGTDEIDDAFPTWVCDFSSENI